MCWSRWILVVSFFLEFSVPISAMDTRHDAPDPDLVDVFLACMGADTNLKVWGPIGDDGALDLAAALKSDSTISTLDLSDNWIGDKGAFAIADMLTVNSTLASLNLLYNSIGDSGLRAIEDGLKFNKSLTVLSLDAYTSNAAIIASISSRLIESRSEAEKRRAVLLARGFCDTQSTLSILNKEPELRKIILELYIASR